MEKHVRYNYITRRTRRTMEGSLLQGYALVECELSTWIEEISIQVAYALLCFRFRCDNFSILSILIMKMNNGKETVGISG